MADVEFLRSAIKAQAERIRELEKQVINLGGNPHGGKK